MPGSLCKTITDPTPGSKSANLGLLATATLKFPEDSLEHLMDALVGETIALATLSRLKLVAAERSPNPVLWKTSDLPRVTVGMPPTKLVKRSKRVFVVSLISALTDLALIPLVARLEEMSGFLSLMLARTCGSKLEVVTGPSALVTPRSLVEFMDALAGDWAAALKVIAVPSSAVKSKIHVSQTTNPS